MNKKQRTMLAVLLSLALLLGLGSGYSPTPGAQAAESNYQDLDQKQIVEAMGAGWNVGNQLEGTDGAGMPNETAFTPVLISENLIRAVKNNGFKSIRIPVSYLKKIGAGPDYTIDEAWLDRIQEVVDMAIKFRLYVIINMHGDGYSSVTGGWLLPQASGQEEIREKYAAVWRQIADRFKDYDQHLIFEGMNEVGADASNDAAVRSIYPNINAYNQTFVDTVRQTGGNNDKRWLLIPGCNTNIEYTAGDYGFELPTDTYRSADIPADQQRIMISVHYYTPWEFCGQEDYNQTQWGEEADAEKSVGYGAEGDMEKSFATLKSVFVDKGYPVIIGEYGAVDKSVKENSGLTAKGEADPKNTTFRAYFAWKLCSEAKKNGCVPVYWDNGWSGDFGYAIFSRGTAQDIILGHRRAGDVLQPEILNAIISVYGPDQGDAESIQLSENKLELEINDTEGVELQATQSPETANDIISWESSDTSVASVSYKGRVKPRGTGTCIITATVPNGASAYCIVKVIPSQSFRAGLYGTTGSYGTLSSVSSENSSLVLREGAEGEYTIKVSGSKNSWNPFRALYMKDAIAVSVGDGAPPSNLIHAKFTIKSLKFNDHECSLDKTEFVFNREDAKGGVLDIGLANAWSEPDTHITDAKLANQGFTFESSIYNDETNTFTLVLQVDDIQIDKGELASEVPVEDVTFLWEDFAVEVGKSASLGAIAAPAAATEKLLYFSENPKIARVDATGTVTGVKEGETVIHVLTAGGIDKTINVLSTTEKLPDPTPWEDPTKTQDPGSSAAPGQTQDPGSSAAPGQTTDPGSSAAPDQPGTTDNPSQSQAPQTSAGPGSSVDPGQTGDQTGGGTQGVTVKKVTLKKVTSPKKKTIMVKWGKLAGVNGYQIKLGTNKKMTKGKKTVTVKKAKTVKATIKKLKSKKKYYVKVRAYKTVDGKKQYGAYSKVKNVRVK